MSTCSECLQAFGLSPPPPVRGGGEGAADTATWPNGPRGPSAREGRFYRPGLVPRLSDSSSQVRNLSQLKVKTSVRLL